MPYAENRGIRIHYRVEGEGPALVLQHGFTQCVDDWYECGYVEALQRDFRLILIDARGHGGSDKPHDPAAYALDRRAGDVTAVLDALHIEKAHFWGYSMGGYVGFGMAKAAAGRLDRLVIGGQTPCARSMQDTRDMIEAGLAGGPDAFLAAAERRWGPAPEEYRARLRAADLHAYLALAQDRPGLDDLLPRIRVPCCLYAGERDPVLAEAQAASRIIPGATFLMLPRFAHAAAFARSDVVVPLVMPFLRGS